MSTPRQGSFAAAQDQLVVLLGREPSSRADVLAGMLRRDPAEATGYWLQLLVAVGIATLGLVLGSSAVVIGAMLIAPLMGPIVNFGMGLAVGSPFLVLRSGGRILASVGVTIGSSALLVRLLPFHEIGPEIAARTTPTLLDLLTAAFCALAGVYATVKPSSDVTSTAAGTSIGISLVPPLCASGFGVGTATWSVASGAALLFLTNLVAIVVVGTVGFAAAGFNRVDIAALERERLGSAGAPVARQLARLFALPGGPWVRLLMPFVLLALLYVPLRRALDEVAWEIRVRGAVREAVAHLPARVVQSKVIVERGEASVALVLLGSSSDAEAARARLGAELRGIAGDRARLEVFAVPDATAFAGLEAVLRAPRPAAVAPTKPSPSALLADARALVREAMERRWPRRAAGLPLVIKVAAAAGDGLGVEVVHLGPALDAVARETLERALAEDLGSAVVLTSVDLPTAEIRHAGDPLEFVARLAPLLEIARSTDAVSVCIAQPALPTGGKRAADAPEEPLRVALRRLVEGHPRASFHEVDERDAWSARVVAGGCPKLEPRPAPRDEADAGK